MAGPRSIVKAGLLIDGSGAQPRRGMAVVVEGNRITDVRPAATLGAVGDRVTEHDVEPF